MCDDVSDLEKQMKSEYLAKADFLRELRRLTTELYELGDFTVENSERKLLEAKLNGFIDAGLLLEAASRADMQKEIDNCHLKVFGESRSDRRQRLAETTDEDPTGGSATYWEKFDSPSFERAKANR